MQHNPEEHVIALPPVDLGRGILEKIIYLPSRKVLQVEWKGEDGGNPQSELLTISENSQEDAYQEIWRALEPLRTYYDLDYIGETPAPEFCHPSILDGSIFVPEGYTPSVERAVQQQAQQEQQTQQAPTTSDNGQPVNAQPGQTPIVNEVGFPTIMVDLQTHTNGQILIETQGNVIKLLSTLLRNHVDDDTVKEIADMQLDHVKSLRNKYLGEFDEE